MVLHPLQLCPHRKGIHLAVESFVVKGAKCFFSFASFVANK